MAGVKYKGRLVEKIETKNSMLGRKVEKTGVEPYVDRLYLSI